MRLRNQLLALACLIVFGALGVFYFRTWVVQKPFGIILFVGEGLTSQRLAAARVFNGGADNPLAIDALEFAARVRNCSADFAVPDAGSAASTLATGQKVRNGTISVSESGMVIQTILEIAHERGRATGLVTDGALSNLTAAAFYAHSNRNQPPEFARDLAERDVLDVALGGGATELAAKAGDFQVVKTLPELENVSAWQHPRLLGLFAKGDLPFTDEVAARSDSPSLAEMTRRAIELLQMNGSGYVLVIDAHLMGSAAWQNMGERTLRETIELDRAVQVARDYAGGKAAIIVTGDVAIGGMNISGYPLRNDSGAAILGLNSAGQPWITWASGPNGGRFAGAAEHDANRELLVTEPATIQAPSALNSIEDPIAQGTGLGMEKLRGTIENTAIFSLMRDSL